MYTWQVHLGTELGGMLAFTIPFSPETLGRDQDVPVRPKGPTGSLKGSMEYLEWPLFPQKTLHLEKPENCTMFLWYLSYYSSIQN